MTIRFFAVIGCLAVCMALLAQPKVGQAAPDFAGTDINGRPHRLSDYRGKIVVLESYSPDCPFSNNHYTTGCMQALQAAVVSKGIVWLVIGSTPPGQPGYRKPDAARKEFVERNMKATAWIDDSNGQISRLYGMKTTPHMFVINQGVLVYQGAVDDRPDSSGDPRTARNYVRTAIEALLASKPVPVSETKPYGSPIK